MFPKIRQNILRCAFAISLWPGIINLVDILQFKLPTKQKNPMHHLLLSANFTAFDRPGFFLQKKFHVEYMNGEVESIDFNSSLYSKIKPYPLSPYTTHALNIQENRSRTNMVLDQIFCSRQINFINLKYSVKQVIYEEINLVSNPPKLSIKRECLQK